MTSRILLLAGKDSIAYAQRPGRESVASAGDLLDEVRAELPAERGRIVLMVALGAGSAAGAMAWFSRL